MTKMVKVGRKREKVKKEGEDQQKMKGRIRKRKKGW